MQGKPARIYTAQHFSPLHQPNTSRPTMTLLVTRPPETNLISEFPARSGEHARIAGRTPISHLLPGVPQSRGKAFTPAAIPRPGKSAPGRATRRSPYARTSHWCRAVVRHRMRCRRRREATREGSSGMFSSSRRAICATRRPPPCSFKGWRPTRRVASDRLGRAGGALFACALSLFGLEYRASVTGFS